LIDRNFLYENFKDLPHSHFFDEDYHHQKNDMKHEKYIEKWKKLISLIKKDEDGRFIVIRPLPEGRIKIIDK